MRTDFTKVLDIMGEDVTPAPSPTAQVERQIEEIEQRLTDMIDKRMNANNSVSDTNQTQSSQLNETATDTATDADTDTFTDTDEINNVNYDD